MPSASYWFATTSSLIGAQQGGATNVLKRHSHGRRQEEIHYFDTPTFRRGVDWYRIHFPHQQQRNGQRVITGEASPNYLFYPHTTRRLAETIPQTQRPRQ